jgi:hypothetical protein
MDPRITPRSRVTVDFLIPERDILQRLCDQDIRPAAEQLRWLVLTEAQRRGILSANANSDGIREDTSVAVAA